MILWTALEIHDSTSFVDVVCWDHCYYRFVRECRPADGERGFDDTDLV